MKIPEKIKIGGFIWEVIESDDIANESATFGSTHFHHQKIFLEAGENQQKKEQCLLHEIMHAIFWQTGLEKRLDNKEVNITEEEFITAVSNGLYQVIKDNPEIWKP